MLLDPQGTVGNPGRPGELHAAGGASHRELGEVSDIQTVRVVIYSALGIQNRSPSISSVNRYSMGA